MFDNLFDEMNRKREIKKNEKLILNEIKEIITKLEPNKNDIQKSSLTQLILTEIEKMLPLSECEITSSDIVIKNHNRGKIIVFREKGFPRLNEHCFGEVNRHKYLYSNLVIFDEFRKKLQENGNYYVFHRLMEEDYKEFKYISERSILATEIQTFLKKIDKDNSYYIDCSGEEGYYQDRKGKIHNFEKRGYKPRVKVLHYIPNDQSINKK